MVIRPATKADVEALCGQRYPNAIRALTVEHDGEPVAIAGVLHSTPMQCFSTMKDVVRQSPKTIVKCAKQLRNILNCYECRILAIAEDREPTAKRFLEFVGFEYLDTTSQGEIYQWQTQ